MREREDEGQVPARDAVPTRDAVGLEAPARCSGALAELAVADVVQLLQLIGKSAVMTITVAHEGGQSRLWCAEGSMVDAVSGRLRGEAAAYRILSLDDGWLEAELRHEQRPRTIYAPTQRLLLEAARRTDEALALKRKLGGVRCCYRLVHEPEPEQLVSPTAAEQRLLQLLSAAPSVGELLAESELGDLETLIALDRWFDAGHLARVGLRPESTSDAMADGKPGVAGNPATTAALSPSVPPLAASVPPLASGAARPSVPGRRRAALLAAGATLLAAASFAGGYVLRDGAKPEMNAVSAQPRAGEPLASPARVAEGAARAATAAKDAPSALASPADATLAGDPNAGARNEPPAVAAPATLESPPEGESAPRARELAAATVTEQEASPVESAAPTARRPTTSKSATRLVPGRVRVTGASPPVSEPRVRVIGVTEPSIRLLD